MALVTVMECAKFNLNEIKKKTLVRAKHTSWDEPRNGIVEKATEDRVIVLFLTGVHSANCYFNILASEVMNGEWDILFTNDMNEIKQIILEPVITPPHCNCGENANKEDIDSLFVNGEAGGSNE